MATRTKNEMSTASTVTNSNDILSLQTKRRESLKTVSSWGNPWSEPLPMTAIPQRRSLPDHRDDPEASTHHSKRDSARTSYHTAPPASVFPAVKRSGWFSFFTASFRSSHSHRQQLLSFESLTKIRCFGEILIRLSDDSINKAQWLKCRGYESPLHLLLEYRPPLTVVNTVIYELKVLGQECPEAICDAKGRNSLHIACATVPSNSVAVVARLLNGQTIRSTTNPAAVMDKQKMLPLHHACNGKVTKSDVESRVLIIRFLSECYPQGVLLQNHRGMTPSDLVRKNGSNPEILMILYQAMVDQRKAASANIKNTSVDMLHNNNTLNSDLVQKYTKSEHRRDGLAAFVQNNHGHSTKVQKHRLPCPMEKDEISDFESMDTFSCIDDISFATSNADRTEKIRNTQKTSTPSPGKNQAVTASDEVSEMDSVYTFGFIADDYSATVYETDASLVPELLEDIPANTASSNIQEHAIQPVSGKDDIDTANDETSTETSDDSFKEPLQCTDASDHNGEQGGMLVDDTMEYSNSETENDVENVTEINTEKTYSLSKYFDTQKLKQPLSLEVDTSSVSLNSLTIDTPSTTTTTPSVDSPASKKSVQFNDRVQIYKIMDLPIDTDDDDQCVESSLKKDTWMDHTDTTESETSTSSSSNTLDDSDRGGSVAIIVSEVVAATSSLMMQRYGYCGVGETNVEATNHWDGHRTTTIDATKLYFL